MSVTLADAGEAVSRPWPEPRRHILTRPPRACRDKRFSHGGYVEGLSEARTPLVDFFSILHRCPNMGLNRYSAAVVSITI